MKKILHSIKRATADQRGSAALELGLLLPMLAVLLAGTVDVGRGLWQHHVAVKAARDGVRYLTRVPQPWANPTYVAQATALVETGLMDGTGQDLVPDIAVTWEFPEPGAGGTWYGGTRSVLGRVSFAFEPFTGFGLIPAVRLEAGHIERHIGE